MTWEDLTHQQRTQARALRERLWKAGVTDVSLSSIVRHLEAVADWAESGRGLRLLCLRAGWSCPVVPEPGALLARAVWEALEKERELRPEVTALHLGANLDVLRDTCELLERELGRMPVAVEPDVVTGKQATGSVP